MKPADLPPPEQLSQGWVSVPLTNEKRGKKKCPMDGINGMTKQNRSSQKKAFDGWDDAPESDDDEDDGVPATDGDGWAVDQDKLGRRMGRLVLTALD